jgi:aryl-alcohol dehydrogenase-like predicted oxidoreductase
MNKTRFGKTELKVSVLGFGAAPAAYLKAERQAASAMVHAMLDAGLNLIDTAASYPGSEEWLGESIGQRRGDFVVVSKIAGKLAEIPHEPWTEASVLAQVDRSLRLLRTEAVDVMLLHSCSLEVLQKGEAIGALVKARDAGKIRFAGYSGDNEAAAFAAGHPELAVIETSVNLADQRNIDQVLPGCVANDIGVLAKRPIANAAWKDLSEQQGLYKNYAKTYTERLATMGLRADDLGVSGPQGWVEMARRFTLSQPGVHCAIVGTTNPEHFQANLRQIAKGPLPQPAIDAIRSAYRQADPAGEWTAQT